MLMGYIMICMADKKILQKQHIALIVDNVQL